jgi:signal transduction histidine kinase
MSSITKGVDIQMDRTPRSLHLSIADDGVGFAPNTSEPRGGLGLVSMRERLHLIGGKFTINSKPGCSTRVEATVSISDIDPATVS